MKKKLKPVEGSADDDIKEIEEANQIRLRAISTMQALLNIWFLHRRHTYSSLLNTLNILV